MEPTPSSPTDSPPAPKRRRRAAIAAVGLVATALLAALAMSIESDGDGGESDDQAHPATTVPDDPTVTTTTQEATTVGGTTAGSTPATPSTSPGAARHDVFDDGLWSVGPDIQPGRYIAATIPGGDCAWSRLADTTGDDVIAAETVVTNQAIVDILGSDTAFRTSGCGTWNLYAAPGPPPLTTIDEGDWVVGEQIQPGVYQAPRTASCHWTRASGFEHTTDEVVQTDMSAISLEGPMHARLTAGERFTTRGCGIWQPSS